MTCQQPRLGPHEPGLCRAEPMSIAVKIMGAPPTGQESLCRTCRCAHIRKGFRESEEAIFCGIGEQLLPVRFKIAECSDYANRNVPYRYELEQMALLINVPVARRKAGFKNEIASSLESNSDE